MQNLGHDSCELTGILSRLPRPTPMDWITDSIAIGKFLDAVGEAVPPCRCRAVLAA